VNEGTPVGVVVGDVEGADTVGDAVGEHVNCEHVVVQSAMVVSRSVPLVSQHCCALDSQSTARSRHLIGQSLILSASMLQLRTSQNNGSDGVVDWVDVEFTHSNDEHVIGQNVSSSLQQTNNFGDSLQNAGSSATPIITVVVAFVDKSTKPDPSPPSNSSVEAGAIKTLNTNKVFIKSDNVALLLKSMFRSS